MFLGIKQKYLDSIIRFYMSGDVSKEEVDEKQKKSSYETLALSKIDDREEYCG